MNDKFQEWWKKTHAPHMIRGTQYIKDIAESAWNAAIDDFKNTACRRHKRWREENPDRWKASMDNWNKNNKERVKAYQHEYYLKKRKLKKG